MYENFLAVLPIPKAVAFGAGVESPIPVAITVIEHSSGYESSYLTPKIMFASSPASSCT